MRFLYFDQRTPALLLLMHMFATIHTPVIDTSVHSIHLTSFPGSSPAFIQYVKKAGEESGNKTAYKYSFDEMILKI